MRRYTGNNRLLFILLVAALLVFAFTVIFSGHKEQETTNPTQTVPPPVPVELGTPDPQDIGKFVAWSNGVRARLFDVNRKGKVLIVTIELTNPSSEAISSVPDIDVSYGDGTKKAKPSYDPQFGLNGIALQVLQPGQTRTWHVGFLVPPESQNIEFRFRPNLTGWEPGSWREVSSKDK